MSTISDELFQIAKHLDSIKAQFDIEDEFDIKAGKLLDRLEDKAITVGKAWSGSWLGHQSRIYYQNLQTPPPGARFSKIEGLTRHSIFQETVGKWVEYDYDTLHQAIYHLADNPNLEPLEKLANKAHHTFKDKREELISLLSMALEERDDSFLLRLKKEAEEIKILSSSDFVNYYTPSGQFISRDTVALEQGLQTPPHIAVLCHIKAIRFSAISCENLAKVAKQAASHLVKQERFARRKQEIGTNVFIGHGRSPAWRDLKDLIQDRLGLPWDEFNRVPVAGITNIARLSEMLNDAAIAFLVMTAEDEQVDGKMRARENVVHEAGLFQGKLGFTKAIVLLEEGCEEFSNIQGLGQIHFPQGNIKAVFEEIRRVLEREGLIPS